MSKEVKRYELRIVDRYAGDGTGDIETDARMKQEAKGRYVLFSDYDALLAEREMLKAALDDIGGLSRALRQGGPDPMDLQDLSNALEEAIDIAHEAISALQGEQL